MWGAYFCLGAYKHDVVVVIKMGAYIHGAYLYGYLLFQFYGIRSTGVDMSNMQGPSGISVHTGSSCANPIVIKPPPKSLESLLKNHAARVTYH